MGNTLKKIHFMGVGGAGISAVCLLSNQAGYEVSGCDLDQDSPFLKQLANKKIDLSFTHQSGHINDIDALVISPAIESLDPDNAELSEARQKNIPVFIGEEFLAKFLLAGKKLIAVSGTHGKSTTTAMIGSIFQQAGLDPTVLVGALVNDWGANVRFGKGDYFILEADEYKEKFLLYQPFIAVITAIEMDHPEYFKNEKEVTEAFKKFALQVERGGSLVLGKNVNLTVDHINKFNFEQKNFELNLLGNFNKENAATAFQVAKIVGIAETTVQKALSKFTGVARRFDFKGEQAGVKIFDDYGHHPSAIEKTITAAKEKFPTGRLWLIYQPHMFTRTAYLFDQFVASFKNSTADFIILVDIYAARQENKENISSLDLAKAVSKETVKYIGDFENTAFYIVKHAVAGDVVVVMGAGDIYKLSDLILRKLKNRA